MKEANFSDIVADFELASAQQRERVARLESDHIALRELAKAVVLSASQYFGTLAPLTTVDRVALESLRDFVRDRK